ncbi:SRPBCC domain-containing protein [Streptomyces sp. SLBN-115]|uniref:SRPBCC domain-containing protein n=1 Tax=Streptomyces sp. SLBN-115 TaxID=2768453 RepID=UPI0011665634|nr:SRPBCC domain-containing protein [Streptomyces sp. SLBN-115]TQJ54553.1 carbon monoxide dehydrogenase subunit G [Streptomyces sp. SLBN-115]TQJ54568.1 carbon monoxide dehydrogenase subunit G [Streptomyces sp. SLBN-115]
MEQEVFVPVPAERLRAALADPAQVARAVPGLQQDAGTEPVAGRLKVRVGGHTITYRGALRVSPREDGAYALEGDATEVRGSGVVKPILTLWLREAEAGTTLRFEGTASAGGRIAELPSEAVDAAVTRLLNRFATNLAAETTETAETAETAEAAEAAEAVDADALDDAADHVDAGNAIDDVDDVDESPVPGAVFEAEVSPAGLEDLAGPGEPPAEAAHARRTMIGRSAEEVDHAPPRGRYAPVPAPQTVVPNSTLRWAAPAAALVVASAIVVGRALRRRG